MKNWSYSRYSTWEQCPAKLKFSMEEGAAVETSPAMSRGTAYHKILENFVRDENAALIDDLEYYRDYLNVLRPLNPKPEMEAAVTKDWTPCDFNSPDRWWRGVYDLVVERPDFTLIVDWKTGNEYADHRKQREIYAITYFALRPVDEIFVTHTYLDKKVNVNSLFKADVIDHLRKRWTNKIDEMFNDKDMVPNPGFHCRWCPFRAEVGGPCRF